MRSLLTDELASGTVHIVHTTKGDGDLSPSVVARDELESRRRRLVDMDWLTVHQVHSDRVITVGPCISGQARLARGHIAIGDALVTAQSNVALAVHSGDCVPVGFVSSSGSIAVAHAGWRGLEVGVLESTVRALRTHRDGDIDAEVRAVVGPHIGADHYEFGESDLERLDARFGPAARSQTSAGRPALDLAAGVSAELDRLDVELVAMSGECTAAHPDDYWSHRSRGERGRFGLVAWIES